MLANLQYGLLQLLFNVNYSQLTIEFISKILQQPIDTIGVRSVYKAVEKIANELDMVYNKEKSQCSMSEFMSILKELRYRLQSTPYYQALVDFANDLNEAIVLKYFNNIQWK